MTERVGPNTCGTWFILKASRTNGKPFLQKFGEGKIIVLFQIFRIFLLDLCVPKYGDHSPKIGDHSLSRPLVTLHLRGSRPSDPRFLLFVLFTLHLRGSRPSDPRFLLFVLFSFSFIIIPRTVYLYHTRTRLLRTHQLLILVTVYYTSL